ncbi:hypothetical protein [Dongshaea marina]|uniref:hypothetical protein n=1 Tax=Dongshaea marina TaxID=2047966 RepID=UPI000D3E34CF|nr:hypothetical protein [Dongshaea marina]
MKEIGKNRQLQEFMKNNTSLLDSELTGLSLDLSADDRMSATLKFHLPQHRGVNTITLRLSGVLEYV